MAVSLAVLTYSEFDFKSIKNDDEALFFTNTKLVFKENNVKRGPTVTQNRIQTDFETEP